MLSISECRVVCEDFDFWLFHFDSFHHSTAPGDSIHVLESWFCTRTAFAQKKIGKWYAWLTTIMTFLVCLSVVLVKQHVLMDILGGIAFFEIGILVTRRRGFEQIYQRMEHWDQWTRRK